MLKLVFSVLLSFMLFSGFSQGYKVVKLENVLDILESRSDSLYIVNFWATWCVPCVREIPYFEELGDKYKEHKMRIILVNLDFKKDIDRKLVPFLEKYKLKSAVWFLDESNPNIFISKIDENWSGAIPFTLFIRGASGIRNWHEGSFTKESLDKEISNILFNH